MLKESLTENKNLALHNAIIKHHVNYHIVFPRAQLGDLQQFLHGGFTVGYKGDRSKDYSFQTMFPLARQHEGYLLALPLLEQCKAIAEALAFLHKGFSTASARVSCAHMDLKPNNILIFDGPELIVGKWKICDFGISVFKEEDGASTIVSIGDLYEHMTFNTRYRRDVSTYQAPEVDHTTPSSASTPANRRVGRRGDVWSFGAIFSEVLAFALKREYHVEEFQRQRTERNRSSGVKNDRFYSLNPGPNLSPEALGFQVRPTVLDWLQDQAKDFGAKFRSVSCWVESIIKILQINPGGRPSPNELEELVRHLEHHARKELQGVPVICSLLVATTPSSESHEVEYPAREEQQGSPVARSLVVPATPSLESREVRSPRGSDGNQSPDSGNRSIRRRSGASASRIEPMLSIPGRDPTPCGLLGSSAFPRNPLTPYMRPPTFPGLSNIKIVALNNERIVYLVKEGNGTHAAHIFGLRPESNPELLMHETDVPLSQPNISWKGVAISSTILVCWGRCGSTAKSKVPSHGRNLMPLALAASSDNVILA